MPGFGVSAIQVSQASPSSHPPILPSVILMEADEPAEPRRRRRRQLLANSGAVHSGAQISLRIALEKAASRARRQSQARGYMKGLFGVFFGQRVVSCPERMQRLRSHRA